MPILETQKGALELPDALEIKRQHEVVKNLEISLAAAKAQLHSMICQAQKECQHNWDKIMQEDPNYKGHNDYRYGVQVLIGWKCRKCFLFKPRPIGPPDKICRKCAGEMELVARVPGQGERTFIYECKECGHAYSHI